MEALEPFRCAAFPRTGDQPAALPYLSAKSDQKNGNLDIQLEAHLRTKKMPRAHCLARSSFRHSYWTPAQIVAHHASNGCNLRPGDLLGSGTISGPTPDALGSMLEITQGGRNPLALPNGETRAFLEDGDEVILRSRCVREGRASIGFGDCAGTIKPAR
jgi:fumarylacetoacetase